MEKFELTREYLDSLRSAIEKQDEATAISLIKYLYAVDIAGIYDKLSIDEAKFLYLLLDGDKAADVLAELEDDDRERFMKVLPSKVIAERFIEHMDSDDAADVIADLPDNRQEEVLSHVEDLEHTEDIEALLRYDENTAGGLMAKELIAVNADRNIRECLKELGQQAEEVDELYYVYVIDDNEVLQGIVSLKSLLLSNTSTKISAICKSDIISVNPSTKAEVVGNIMDKYDLVALPVVDASNKLLGRITIDDVVDVIREEAEKDYQLISGITEDVEPSDKIWVLTRARLPWLFIGLLGGIFGSRIISLYQEDLEANTAMAFFFPLIAAMGGNVGVQSSSIVVQGLANDTLGIESTFRKIFKEFSVAIINALACSLVIFLYNLFFSDSFALTITVSIALLIVMVFASTFGTFVPMVLNRFKIDPALATGPFITTVNDILGVLIYLIISRIVFDIIA